MLSVRQTFVAGLAVLSFAPNAFANADLLRDSLSGKDKGFVYSDEQTTEMERKRLHFLNTHIGSQPGYSEPVQWTKGNLSGTFKLDTDTSGRFYKTDDKNIQCLRYVHDLVAANQNPKFRGYACSVNGVWTKGSAKELTEVKVKAETVSTPDHTPQASSERTDKPVATTRKVEEVKLPTAPGPLGLDHTYKRNMISPTVLGNMVYRLRVMRATLQQTLANDKNLPTMGESSKAKYLLDAHTSWTRHYASYFAWGFAATAEKAAVPPLMGEGQKGIGLDQLLILLKEEDGEFKLMDEAKVALVKIFLGFEWNAKSGFSRRENVFSRVDVREGSLKAVLELIQDKKQRQDLAQAFLTAVRDEDQNDKRSGDKGMTMVDHIRDDLNALGISSSGDSRPSKPTPRRNSRSRRY